MPTKPTDRSTRSDPNAASASKPKTVAASKVGLSLTIKDKALKDFDRIQAETTKEADEIQKFSWR